MQGHGGIHQARLRICMTMPKLQMPGMQDPASGCVPGDFAAAYPLPGMDLV
jgi:hypothetical protein